MALNRVALGVLLLGLSGQAHAASDWDTFTRNILAARSNIQRISLGPVVGWTPMGRQVSPAD